MLPPKNKGLGIIQGNTGLQALLKRPWGSPVAVGQEGWWSNARAQGRHAVSARDTQATLLGASRTTRGGAQGPLGQNVVMLNKGPHSAEDWARAGSVPGYSTMLTTVLYPGLCGHDFKCHGLDYFSPSSLFASRNAVNFLCVDFIACCLYWCIVSKSF